MIKLYDTSMALAAILQNAFNISYAKRDNEIWTAGFSLPSDDPKCADCLAFRYVEIYDGAERVELFRILPSKFDKTDITVNTYQCEHVLSTLLDDILFQYHQQTGYTITQNITYVLSLQSTAKWVVNTVEFADVIDFNWENINLLSALFSIPKALAGAYAWTYDTTVYPWKLNLIESSAVSVATIRYKKNLVSIQKTSDPSYIVTRLYPLGYGEGINQLDIKSVNGGVAHIDASTIGTYGVMATTFIAKEVEDAQRLMDLATAYLETVKTPRVAYSVQGVDLYLITDDPVDNFKAPGSIITVIDDDLGTFNARVVSVSKPNLNESPDDVQIEISNKVLDSADSTVTIQEKQHINDVYAQGATNIDSNDYQDNCDHTHPATIEFYIPLESVNVNKCLLTYKTDYFRAYETGAASGGGSAATSSSGGGSTPTTASGGSSTPTTSSGGDSTPTSASGGSSTPTSASGGAETSASGGDHRHKMFQFGGYEEFPTTGRYLYSARDSALNVLTFGMDTDDSPTGFVDGDIYTEGTSGTHTHVGAAHTHGVTVPAHTHGVTVPTHTHGVTVPAHTHGVTVPAHTHGVTVPAHTHDVTVPAHTHDVTIPAHAHDITYGIYQFGYLPASLVIDVDGVTIPNTSSAGYDIDIVPYLSVTSGKIDRGWHTVQIYPDASESNPSGLARITAAVIKMVFIQSHEGYSNI